MARQTAAAGGNETGAGRSGRGKNGKHLAAAPVTLLCGQTYALRRGHIRLTLRHSLSGKGVDCAVVRHPDNTFSYLRPDVA